MFLPAVVTFQSRSSLGEQQSIKGGFLRVIFTAVEGNLPVRMGLRREHISYCPGWRQYGLFDFLPAFMIRFPARMPHK